MRINKERLLLSNTPLMRFGSTKVFPIGSIALLVTIGTYPQQITKEITFLVVEFSSTNNTIIGRPTLDVWKEVTSIYNLPSKISDRVQDRGGTRGPNGGRLDRITCINTQTSIDIAFCSPYDLSPRSPMTLNSKTQGWFRTQSEV